MMEVDTVNSDIVGEVMACDAPEDKDDAEDAGKLPPIKEQSEDKNPWNSTDSHLVSVPENELLLHVDPSVQLGGVQPGVVLSTENKATNEDLDNTVECDDNEVAVRG